MSEPFIGEIRAVGFNFAPRNWAMCNGQLLPIAQNTALFSILGTTYGGNGTTTFALPNLQGRAAMHAGQGNGLSNHILGEAAGQESVTLTQANLPSHTHTLLAAPVIGNTTSPANAALAVAAQGVPMYGPASDAVDTLHAQALGYAGTASPQPHNNMQPYLVLNYVIALQGVFPSRN